jgi:hypothetical protein
VINLAREAADTFVARRGATGSADAGPLSRLSSSSGGTCVHPRIVADVVSALYPGGGVEVDDAAIQQLAVRANAWQQAQIAHAGAGSASASREADRGGAKPSDGAGPSSEGAGGSNGPVTSAQTACYTSLHADSAPVHTLIGDLLCGKVRFVSRSDGFVSATVMCKSVAKQ